MGISSSQATLLFLTSRIMDNELRSQMITNSKVRLATDQSDAAAKYVEALNASQLMYSTYDADGSSISQKMTAGLIMSYGELKNQYGLINTSGQLLVGSTDKINYEKSNTLSEFLACYDVPLTENPKYAQALSDLYGENYAEWFDKNDITGLYDFINEPTNPLMSVIGNYDSNTGVWSVNYDQFDNNNNPIGMSQALYDKFVNGLSNNGIAAWAASLGYTDETKPSGIFGAWVEELMNYPKEAIGTKPNTDDYWVRVGTEEGDELYEKFDLASKPCYQNAQGGSKGCYEHVLAHLLDLDMSYASYPKSYTTSNGSSLTFGSSEITGSAIYFAGLSPTLIEVSNAVSNTNPAAGQVLYCLEKDETALFSGISNEAKILLSNYVLDSNGDYVTDASGNKVLKTIKQKAVDLFYVIEDNEGANSLGLNYNWLLQFLDSFEADMKNAFMRDEFDKTQYQKDMNDYEARVETFYSWLNTCEEIKSAYRTLLENLPDEKVANENDPKYEWYKNLWYRMGGISETSKAAGSDNYAELNAKLMNNAEWLQFALENGIISMEQVIYQEEGSAEYKNMGNSTWKSKSYSVLNDISSRENSLAIAKAEVEYQNAVNEIQAKDKKYDIDLKKLDAEHSAMQTEYESVKNALGKSVERGFKAFS